MGQFPALSPSTMLSLLISLTFACCVSASPVGPHGQEGALLNAGLSLAAQLGGGSQTCDMVEVLDSVCAVLYDEEKCKAQSDHLVLGDGDQGVLPLLSRGGSRQIWCLIDSRSSGTCSLIAWPRLMNTNT